MRCKNCGWDNPKGNAKCEKCNAPLEGSMVDDGSHGNEREAADYQVKTTVQGCFKCGYPKTPSQAECPNCGYSENAPHRPKSEAQQHQWTPDEPSPSGHPQPSPGGSPSPGGKPSSGGTVIRGTNRTDSHEPRKKLVGFLVTYSRSQNGVFFPLYEGRNAVGSDPSQNVHIEGDTQISGKHLFILYRVHDRKFKIKDEMSTNGTFINGDIIDEGELKNFDMIRIGDTHLVFMAIPDSAFE